MKTKLSHDVYDISNRVKEIDRDYYIVYDTFRRKYEVHNSSQIGSSYCLTSPYEDLDFRTLTYIHKTKVSNIDEILSSIDRENELRDSEAKSEAISMAEECVEEEMER